MIVVLGNVTYWLGWTSSPDFAFDSSSEAKLVAFVLAELKRATKINVCQNIFRSFTWIAGEQRVVLHQTFHERRV